MNDHDLALRDAENDIDSVQSTMLIASDLNGYATESWVNTQNFAGETWVENQGYALDLRATEHPIHQSKYGVHLQQYRHD